MLALARANAAKAGASNVEFLKGEIEDLPLPDASVDVVISNCVINLSTDKPAVLAEMFRVLAPGGRIWAPPTWWPKTTRRPLSVLPRALTSGVSPVPCPGPSNPDGLAAAGFADASVTFTNEAAPGMHSAIIRSLRPVTA